MAGNKLLLLNGPSSAGKSTIAKELRQKLRLYGADPAVISIDDYMKISTEEEIWEDDVFDIMPDMCRDIAAALRQGQWVIVDHVITSARIYDALLEATAGFSMITVLVTCCLETLRKREGNAATGSRAARKRPGGICIPGKATTCASTARRRDRRRPRGAGESESVVSGAIAPRL